MEKNIYENLTNSASKVVLLLLAVAIIPMTFIGILGSDQFMTLAAMVFTFYFTRSKPSMDNHDTT